MKNFRDSRLFTAQEEAYTRLHSALGDDFSTCKLCGGTAISRCFLNHRLSYDLDFFVPPEVGAVEKIHSALKCSGQRFSIDRIQLGADIHAQFFLRFPVNDLDVHVSFFEDRYYRRFPSAWMPMGKINVQTEAIEGLYHRKLRTIAGTGVFREGDAPEGSRQTARDIFDLYVLSKKIKPISQFFDEAEDFPVDAFYNGLALIEWHRLADELSRMVVSDEWKEMLDLERLITAIMGEVNMAVVDEETDDAGPSPY
ncbi:MAG: nucleotidyl transferase AbiEii/AbiGii toxin family protein [Desulfovibrio sp.]|nr:nucleotidyl transferase AbiEii/AbiGii toxin family protein [Desulfovibrio sp.]